MDFAQEPHQVLHSRVFQEDWIGYISYNVPLLDPKASMSLNKPSKECLIISTYQVSVNWSFKSAKSSNAFKNNIQSQYLTGERLGSYKIWKILF